MVYLTISLWYGALDNILSKPFFRGFELASPGNLIFFFVIKQAGFLKTPSSRKLRTWAYELSRWNSKSVLFLIFKGWTKSVYYLIIWKLLKLLVCETPSFEEILSFWLVCTGRCTVYYKMLCRSGQNWMKYGVVKLKSCRRDNRPPSTLLGFSFKTFQWLFIERYPTNFMKMSTFVGI